MQILAQTCRRFAPAAAALVFDTHSQFLQGLQGTRTPALHTADTSVPPFKPDDHAPGSRQVQALDIE